ncbi:hypothetical protein EI94DRAFT_321099 [Lactarius quietus]|nr:hypothetical protein EI94DRAFT_321099 [Lactarius quietus]
MPVRAVPSSIFGHQARHRSLSVGIPIEGNSPVWGVFYDAIKTLRPSKGLAIACLVQEKYGPAKEALVSTCSAHHIIVLDLHSDVPWHFISIPNCPARGDNKEVSSTCGPVCDRAKSARASASHMCTAATACTYNEPRTSPISRGGGGLATVPHLHGHFNFDIQ